MVVRQKVKQINCKIISEVATEGTMAYFKEFKFIDLIKWVWRNCQGCIKIEIIPNVNVSAIFEDRVEIYNLTDGEIPANIPLTK